MCEILVFQQSYLVPEQKIYVIFKYIYINP